MDVIVGGLLLFFEREKEQLAMLRGKVQNGGWFSKMQSRGGKSGTTRGGLPVAIFRV
jgi:hypothetical protein